MAIPDQDTRTDDVPEGAIVREGDYGSRVVAVEPGGAEFIPLHERHGSPLQLFWTWVSPNMEFATIFVGVLGVAAFGLSFWQAFLAIRDRHRRSVASARACCPRRDRCSGCRRWC